MSTACGHPPEWMGLMWGQNPDFLVDVING